MGKRVNAVMSTLLSLKVCIVYLVYLVYNLCQSSKEIFVFMPISISLRSILIWGTEYSALLGRVSVKVP